jgi:hypothetical protein
MERRAVIARPLFPIVMPFLLRKNRRAGDDAEGVARAELTRSDSRVKQPADVLLAQASPFRSARIFKVQRHFGSPERVESDLSGVRDEEKPKCRELLTEAAFGPVDVGHCRRAR